MKLSDSMIGDSYEKNNSIFNINVNLYNRM